MQAPAKPKDPPFGNSGHLGDQTTRKLCLLGASVRAAAQSAQRAGIQVFAVDRFGDKDTLEVSDAYLRLPDLDADPKHSNPNLGRNLHPGCIRCPFWLWVGFEGWNVF